MTLRPVFKTVALSCAIALSATAAAQRGGGGGAIGGPTDDAPAAQERRSGMRGGGGRPEGGLGGAVAASRVQIGIAMDRVSDALAAQLNIKPEERILVVSVLDDGPAAKAGLRRYDIITAVDGESTVTPQTIREALRNKEPGDELTLRVLRSGQEREVVITLAEAPMRVGGRGGFSAPVAPEQIKIIEELRSHWREFRPELDDHLKRLREASDSLRETLKLEWREHWEDFEIDEETRERLSQWFERAADRAAAALERAASSLEDVEVEIDVRAPRIEIMRERSNGRGMVVHPQENAVRGAAEREVARMMREFREGGGATDRDWHRPAPGLERRMGALEERLERMEQMMRRLLEREGE